MASLLIMNTEIRMAREEDLPAITEIYNQAIRTSTATFDMVEKTVEDRRQWLAEHGENYPVVVAVVDGEVAGWGSLSKYGERPGWRFTVENAVYISPEFQGKGIGKLILCHLTDLAKRLGYHAAIAQVVGRNEVSVRLHEKCGFETVGVLKEAGNKFDQWLDIVLMEKVFHGG
jgi:phosphinothricin acetyltransferase